MLVVLQQLQSDRLRICTDAAEVHYQQLAAGTVQLVVVLQQSGLVRQCSVFVVGTIRTAKCVCVIAISACSDQGQLGACRSMILCCSSC